MLFPENLRVIKPRSVIPALRGTGSPIQSEIILELFADLRVAVVEIIFGSGRRVGYVSSSYLHAEGMVIGNMCVGMLEYLLLPSSSNTMRVLPRFYHVAIGIVFVNAALMFPAN